MNATTNTTAFHPYKVVQQGRDSLQLKASANHRIIIIVLRMIPILMIGVGIVLFITQKESVFLITFGGIGLLEAFIFTFIKIPASISIDNVGFTLETLSIKGRRETYYLWADIDFIRYKIVRAKNSTSLTYEAVLKTGKKFSFLSFPNYHQKREAIPELNSVLNDISNKEIREK